MSALSFITRLLKPRRGDPNVVGQAYALTTFSPIVPGKEEALEGYLQAVPMGPASPWTVLRGLHFLRLHVVTEFVHQGPSQRPDPLGNGYLVTEATFDGSFPAFMRDMCLLAAKETEALYGHCVGFPGTRDPAAFQRWAERNRIDVGTVLVAYPGSNVDDVRKALRAREQAAAFAVRAQGMDSETLWREFRAAFPPSDWIEERRS